MNHEEQQQYDPIRDTVKLRKSKLPNHKKFRNKKMYGKSYFNLLIEYNSTKAKQRLPGSFEYLQVMEAVVMVKGVVDVFLIHFLVGCWTIF